MKGLLIKEFLGMRRYFKTLGLMLGLYVVICVFTKSTAILAALGGFLAMICTLSAFSYDNYNHWDEFALSLPLTRKNLVQSKYLFMIIISLVAAIILGLCSLVIGLISGIPMLDLMAGALGGLLASLLLGGLVIPLVYIFGVEKARYALIIVVILITLGATGLSSLAMSAGLPIPTESNLTTILYLSPLVALALMVLSYFVSLRAFTKKEL